MTKNAKVWVFVALCVLLLVLNAVFGWSARFDASGASEYLRALMQENLVLAVLAYLAFCVVGSVLLALPGVLFALVAGACFGPVWGTLLCVLGCGAGAVVAFVVARYFLRDSIKPKALQNKLLATWLYGSQANAVVVLAVTRLVPLFPFNLQNFAYGTTDVSLGTYTWCTLLFMLPGTALYTVAAAGVFDAEHRVICFVIAGLLLAFSLVTAWVLRKKYQIDKAD